MATIPIKTTATSNLTVTIPTGAGASTVSVIGGGGSGGGGSGFYTMNNGWNTTGVSDIKSNAIHVNGDAVFKGNITWQDRDMREWFESVESKLGMLQPNREMEETWDELKRIGDQYRELEKKFKEQQRVFDVLKKE